MTSQFSTMQEFINMHGFGAYVWSAYGFCLIMLVLLAIVSIHQYKKRLRILKKTLQHQTKRKNQKKVVITYE